MNVVGKVSTFFRTLFCCCLGFCIILVTIVPAMIILLIFPARYNRENPVLFWFLHLFYCAFVGGLFVPTTIIGKGNIPQESAIIVANHQSSLDIPVVGSLLSAHPHVWYALTYYINTPVLGFFIRRLGIMIDHNGRSNAASSLRQGIKFAQEFKSHIIIFPEGGRYNDGTIHEFLHGFAMLARISKRPVVPVFMPYNGKIYPTYSLLVYWHPLKVVIGQPFVYGEHDTDEIFVQRVYTWFVEQNSALH